MIALVSLMFVAVVTTVNSQILCVNYTGTVCRDVIGSGPVLADTATEAGFEAYKKNYTALGVNVDAKCEAFLRAQYCGLSLVTCSGEVRCGPYSENEIGQCGVNSCPCPGSGFIQQACNAGLKFGFSVIGGGLSYYKTGEQPGNMNCTTINIPCPSAAMGLKFSLIGLLATTVITSLGVLVL